MHQRDIEKELEAKHMMVKRGGNTLRNEELIRQKFAISDFISTLKQSVAMHQITNKRMPSQVLSDDTQSAFYMRELSIMTPESHAGMLSQSD